MSKRDDGGPAFPTQYTNGSDGEYWQETKGGMTLRDYFAAAALPACITSTGMSLSSSGSMKIAADVAYGYADAMLKERAK